MADSKYIKHRTKVVLDTATGEVRSFTTKLTMHREEFFCAYLRDWGDFGDREGVRMRVFVSCILVSRLSVFGGAEGNVFSVSVAIKHACDNIQGMKEQNARQHIKHLVRDGFLLRTNMRGQYYINPKYGIKGTISDQSYLELVNVVGKRDGFVDPHAVTFAED